MVRTEHVPIARLAPALQGYTIAHLSDLHFTGWRPLYDQVRHALQAARPDVVAVTGDICHRPYQTRHGAMLLGRLMEGIDPPDGWLIVGGNHDHLHFSERVAELVRARPAGLHWPDTARLIEQRVHRVTRGGSVLLLAGLRQKHPVSTYADAVATLLNQHRRPEADADAPAILLAHHPVAATVARSMRVDLTLAGHTHGGQWALPGVHLLHRDPLPKRYIGGLHRLDRGLLNVSRGIGVSGPFRFRLFCRPELVLLVLTSARPDAMAGRPGHVWR